MPEHNQPVTYDDLSRAFVWLAAIGKALVKEGVISTESIVAELETIKTGGGQPPEMIRDIDGMDQERSVLVNQDSGIGTPSSDSRRIACSHRS
jgi:hypothetical protein